MGTATDSLRRSGWLAEQGGGSWLGGAVKARIVRACVSAVEDRCRRCRSKVLRIIGVLVKTAAASRVVSLADIEDPLVAVLDRGALATRGVGEPRHRKSPGVADGYIANGGVECDALISRFRLDDPLADHRAAGGTLARLDIGVTVDLRANDATRAALEHERV